MQRDLIVKGRSLGGSSDLTLLAKIKPGFIESLESVTYKTRIKRVLETLHGARMASHEHATARLLSDSVERVAAILSVRVAVFEPEDKVLLSVSFDGSWHAYIRVLWEKVGTLLDLIFWGTEGYVTAYEHSFDEWMVWAMRVQTETGFFYGPPDSTARDALYQRRFERMQQRGVHQSGAAPEDLAERADLNLVRTMLPGAETAVDRLVNPPNQCPEDEPRVAYVGAARMVRERMRNGLQALAVLYRLTDLHRPGTPDGEVLRRAAAELLLEFVRMRDYGLVDEELAEARTRFDRQLDWLFPKIATEPTLPARPRPAPPGESPLTAALRADVQGGILHRYHKITHGLVLMLAFDDAAAAEAFLAHVEQRGLTADADTPSDPRKAVPGRVFRNLAFTAAGLRALGMDEDTLELFPEEFRQGMASRAGLLGDVRHNHPRRWRLPGRYAGIDQQAGSERVGMDAVHAVLQLRTLAREDELEALELHETRHPLRAEVQALEGALIPGLRLLAVQPLRRRYADVAPGDDEEKVVEHFGFVDGGGQPEYEPRPSGNAQFRRNRVHLGEILLGHDNAADTARCPLQHDLPLPVRERQRWMANGSFLVMRKYRQFPGRLHAAVKAAAEAMAPHTTTLSERERVETVYAKLMGRRRDGHPLLPSKPQQTNDFTFDLDPEGRLCPLQAHIRRAHPRLPSAATSRAPRLMRRSMAYGPAVADRETPRDDADRGLLFMAYNASLGEQFEVVQRWLVGANSTGGSSGVSCPIMGVPDNGVARHFAFEYKADPRLDGGKVHEVNKVQRVELEAQLATTLFEEPPVMTQLEWGLYLFTPSLSVLRRLRSVAAEAARLLPATAVPWQLQKGRERIAALRQTLAEHGEAAAIEAWKAAIEDPEAIDRLDAAAVWAAIRHDHQGLLKTPYGVLVASRELLHKVLCHPGSRYSVSGQMERMRQSFGEIALGQDEGPVYRQAANPVNDAIRAVPSGEAYKIAFDATTHKLDAIVKEAREQSGRVDDARFEVGVDARELTDEVLADLCDAWFGLADDAQKPELRSSLRLRRGGADWHWKAGEPPLYPGHFTALSRYMFQPNPGPMAQELGQGYGRALREAMRSFVADHRARGTLPMHKGAPARVAAAVFQHPTLGRDDDWVARTMVGVLMGFNPTIIGAVLNVLREWHRDGLLADLRTRLGAVVNTTGRRIDLDDAKNVLGRAMGAASLMRPMPQIAWRTALEPHRLGGEGPHGVDVAHGDKVVLALVSGTQQSLGDGYYDGRLMFGGARPVSDSSPTHACPGWAQGIEAMLGTLAALLSYPETLRPGAAALGFVLEGPTKPLDPAARPSAQVAAEPDALAAAQALKAQLKQLFDAAMQLPNLPPAGPPESLGLVLAWGDSWLDHSHKGSPIGTDLRDWLEIFGYRVPETFCKYSRWLKAKTLAASPQEFCDFLDSALMAPAEALPVALLISAGGNDSTENALRAMLKQNPRPQDAQTSFQVDDVIDAQKLDAHLNRVADNYRTVLRAIKRVLQDNSADHIPVILHAYDHPLPAGKSMSGDYAKKWLLKPFEEFGWKWAPNGAPHKALTAQVMKHLIDQLNLKIQAVAKEFSNVHHVNLSGTIDATQPHDPVAGWIDDLHPSIGAFRMLAAKLHARIEQVRPAASKAAAAPAPDARPSA